MRLLLPGRILNRHVGGNTTYAAALERGMIERGYSVERMPQGRNPVETLLRESALAWTKPKDTVLHYTADTGPLLGARASNVVTVHGVASRWIAVARTPGQERIWRLRVSRAVAAADAVITVSHSSARDIAEVFGIPEEQVRVIYHGIEAPAPAVGEPIDAEGRLSDLGPYLLFLGNIEPRKNLVSLIAAHREIREKNPGFPQLVIAGKPAWNYGPSMTAIQAAVERGHVKWLGFVSEEEKAWLLANCIAFVFPSLYEGFGLPVLEAMAHGALVVCTSAGSLDEVKGPALVFEGTDVRSIIDGLSLAVGDSEAVRASRRSGPAWASRFSWTESMERHDAVYQEVLAE